MPTRVPQNESAASGISLDAATRAEASFNLLLARWIPVRCADGSVRAIPPTELAGAPAPLALAWPRADFRLAGLEFLIGLLSTAFPPADEDEWLDRLLSPPAPEKLERAFAPIAHAFDLDGNGPRFLQDLEEAAFAGPPEPAQTLLIEAPGDQTIRQNTALLVKPGQVRALGRPAAAIALYTLQAYAPSGGRGNLTSLRGGGPMTTLVLPGTGPGAARPTLWQTVWANVRCGRAPDPSDILYIFPWLAPTRTADKGPTTPADAHGLQKFWGMPRRIRLDFTDPGDGGTCDLLGIPDSRVVVGWRQRPNGVRYLGWRHPLSPYYKAKDGSMLAVHPGPGGVGYRDWQALVLGDPVAQREPACCVADFRGERAERLLDADPAMVRDARLLAGGYDMDNMKARRFVEAELPLLASADPLARARQTETARRLTRAAEEAAGQLRSALRLGLRLAGAKPDNSLLAAPLARFWRETEADFFRILVGAQAGIQAEIQAGNPTEAQQAACRTWLELLRNACLAIFDQAAPVDPDMDFTDAEVRVRARRMLEPAFRGFGKGGKALFEALALPLPETGPRQRRRRSG